MTEVNSNPLISVIMPTYNQAVFLREAIASVLAQDYANWELIIIDNFSSDASELCAASFDDSRIRYIKFQNQGVIAASRNRGIEQSKGEYVAFLDSDDLWTANKLSVALPYLASGIDFLCTQVRLFGENLRSYSSPVMSPQAVEKPYDFILTTGNFISTSTVLVKRSILGKGFSEDKRYVTAEDLDLWLSLLAKSNIRFGYIAEPLTNYRIHSSNSSAKIAAHIKAGVAVFRKWDTKTATNSKYLIKLEARLWSSAARSAIDKNEPRFVALEYLFKSFKLFPCNLRFYKILILVILPKKIQARLLLRLRPD